MIDATEQAVMKTLVREHAMPALQLALATHTPVGRMMEMIERLEAKGFLRRKDPDSRSGGVVVATPKGEQEIQALEETV